ncbi:MAG: ABC transporter ATP-binding protein [Anaerolineales bacterium]|nr:ABC transporter ATP-binding protein [Anaerolineales bacterium]
MTELAIQTDSLRKEFGAQVAVRGLSLEVRRAEVFGFLGPNGAGKTTSIKMLLGLVAPTSGGGALLGAPLGHQATRGRVGFLPEHFRFHDWLTAQEFLTLHGRLHGLAPAALRRRIDDLLERVGLAPFRDKQLRTYSKGMLQRVGLAQALINTPDLVFLDEPTSGLDPVGRRLVRDLIREVRDAGTTVFLNSHLLGEIEVTCDRVAFIQHGEIVRTEALNALAAGEVQVTVRASGLTPVVLTGLERWASAIRADAGQATLVLTQGEAQLPELNRYLVAQGCDVFALTPQRLSLEEIFIRTVGTEGIL